MVSAAAMKMAAATAEVRTMVTAAMALMTITFVALAITHFITHDVVANAIALVVAIAIAFISMQQRG